MDFKINIGKWKFNFYKEASDLIDEPILGINSDVYGDFDYWSDYHILMIDYDDNLSFNTLMYEIGILQRTYDLGHCHIIQSSPKKYHAVFFDDAFDYFDCLRVIHESSACKYFKKQRMLRKNTTLRISKKYRGDFGKPILKAIVMHYPQEPIQYPPEVEQNIRDFKKFYLQYIQYEKEVIVKNGQDCMVSSNK